MAASSLTLPEREPALTVGTVTAAATAVIALGAAFGLPVTDDQQAAILAVVAIAAPFIVGALTRPRVTPNAKVVEYVNTATEPDTVVAGQASPYRTGTVLNARGGDLP